MNRVKIIIVICVIGAAVMAAAGLVLSGVIPLSNRQDSARPPCEQLLHKDAVVAAMAQHKDLVSRIQSVGSGVKVDVGTPCKGQPDRALVSISYTTDAEQKGVDAILRDDGFGVPAELVKD